MSSTPLSRNEKKYLAALRAQFNLVQTCERIDFVEDVINPTKAALQQSGTILEIEASNEEIAKTAINLDKDKKPVKKTARKRVTKKAQ